MITGFFCAALCALAPGQVTIDGQANVLRNGEVIGRYVDNEAPDQAGELATVDGLRLAGVAPYGPLPDLPGAIRLREFYPRSPTERPRRGDGYILPASFHWPDRRAYTMAERRRAWCAALARHPIAVVWYGWTDVLGPKIQAMMKRPCL